MADKLHFSLVTPEREVLAGEVDQVVVPGVEGDFGVLPEHAPLMSTIRPGWLTVHDGNDVERIVIRGGFAEVTPAGLTVLAEQAAFASELDRDELARAIQDAREDLADASTDTAREAAQDQLDYLLVLQDAAQAA